MDVMSLFFSEHAQVL